MLVDTWRKLGSELPTGWRSADLRLELRSRDDADTAAGLLGPAQPFRTGPTSLRFSVARDGTAPSPDGIQRLLRRLDTQPVFGTLSLVEATSAPAVAPAGETTLVESWERELQQLPADWTDVVGEIELESSDYVEKASLLCVPMNLRRDGRRSALRFRTAARFGYGASPEMVRRCLERCDEARIRGTVRVLEVLSDTRPVATQGPVWLRSGVTI